MSTSISYNSNDLQTSSIITSEINHHNAPDKNQPMYALGHANQSVIPFTSYPSKVITIEGKLVSSSISGLDTLIDTFKAYFNDENASLDIGYAGGTRRYTCVPRNPEIDRPGGLAFADFRVIFDCPIPFGIATSATTLLDGGTGGDGEARTMGSYSDDVTFLGSFKYQAPVFTYTLTAFTYDGSDTTASVIVGNNATGQAITVSRAWAADDVLVVDTSTVTPTVKVNGTAVDYTGAFPYFAPGDQTITYSDTFATRTFDETITYVKRYA